MEKRIRVDKYLWAIRVFKTRSLATEACGKGRVKCNDISVKASRNVTVGETFFVTTNDRKWVVKATALIEKRVAYAVAIQHYEDLTPPEDKLENAMQASSFYTGKRLSKVGRPTKKDRRDIDDFLE